MRKFKITQVVSSGENPMIVVSDVYANGFVTNYDYVIFLINAVKVAAFFRPLEVVEIDERTNRPRIEKRGVDDGD